jgi:hypothetical protein
VPDLLAQTTTTTTEVPRVVGKHPGTVPVLGAGAGLLLVIVAASAYVTWRTRRSGAAATRS